MSCFSKSARDFIRTSSAKSSALIGLRTCATGLVEPSPIATSIRPCDFASDGPYRIESVLSNTANSRRLLLAITLFDPGNGSFASARRLLATAPTAATSTAAAAPIPNQTGSGKRNPERADATRSERIKRSSSAADGRMPANKPSMRESISRASPNSRAHGSQSATCCSSRSRSVSSKPPAT